MFGYALFAKSLCGFGKVTVNQATKIVGDSDE